VSSGAWLVFLGFWMGFFGLGSWVRLGFLTGAFSERLSGIAIRKAQRIRKKRVVAFPCFFLVVFFPLFSIDCFMEDLSMEFLDFLSAWRFYLVGIFSVLIGMGVHVLFFGFLGWIFSLFVIGMGFVVGVLVSWKRF